MNPIDVAIEELGGWGALARALDVSAQAIRKWRDAGRLPRTELTGETDYAHAIEKVTQGVVTAESLRDWTRRGWTSNAA